MAGPNPIVQFKTGVLFLPPGTDTITLDSPVTEGSILLAFSVLNTYNTPFTPTDNLGNSWQGPFPVEGDPYSYPTWYALNVQGGTTTVTFPGFDEYNDTSGAWVIVLEIAGWVDFDGIVFNSSDPPDEEVLTSPTSSSDDIILSIWGGPNDEPPIVGIETGAESTLITSASIAYYTYTWGVLVQYQTTGAPGNYDSTASFYDAQFEMGMAIAFKRPTVVVPYTQIPLSTDDVLIWTSNSKLSPYIPSIEFFDTDTQEWVIATTENFFVDPQQILSTWEQGGIYRAVNINGQVVVQWFSEINQTWVNQYLVDPDFVRPDPSGAPAGPLVYP